MLSFLCILYIFLIIILSNSYSSGMSYVGQSRMLGYCHYLVLYWIHFLMLYVLLISSNLWVIYFILELQWLLLTFTFLVGNLKGILYYIIFNSIVSFILLIGLIVCNINFFILGIFLKFGFFPLIMLYVQLMLCANYLFMSIDIINKWGYYVVFLSLVSTSLRLSIYKRLCRLRRIWWFWPWWTSFKIPRQILWATDVQIVLFLNYWPPVWGQILRIWVKYMYTFYNF